MGTVHCDFRVRGFITEHQAGTIFCHNNFSRDCLVGRCIHRRFWQTVRHLIAVCLLKILQPSHPTLHLLIVKGAILVLQIKPRMKAVGFLVQVKHPCKLRLLTAVHRWESRDKLERASWQSARSPFSCASVIYAAYTKCGRLLCYSDCQSKLIYD